MRCWRWFFGDKTPVSLAGSLEAVFYQWSMRGGSKDGVGALLDEAIAAVREAAYSQVCGTRF